MFLRNTSTFDAAQFTFSSARVKPRPARTRRLYLMVGHRTTGRSLSTGRGATAAALAMRASRRRCFRPGCAIHVSRPNSYPANKKNFLDSKSLAISFGIREFSGRGEGCWIVVPGRSAHGHDAASPCGSLFENSLITVPSMSGLSRSLYPFEATIEVQSDGSLTVLLNLVVVLDRLYIPHTIGQSTISFVLFETYFDSSISFNRTGRMIHCISQAGIGNAPW